MVRWIGDGHVETRVATDQVFELERRNVLGSVFGRIGIGDILGQNFLALRQPVDAFLDDAEHWNFVEIHERRRPSCFPSGLRS